MPKAGKQTEEKVVYQGELKILKDKTQSLLDEASAMENEMKENDDDFNSYRRIALGFTYLEIVEHYCRQNDLSVQLLKKVNETNLGDARKYYVKALQEFEEVWTKWVDPDQDEIKEKLALVDRFTPPRQLVLLYRLRDRLTRLREAYGEQSKWRWAFVEMEARAAIILKNGIDFRSAYKNDPRMAYFEERTTLIHNIQELLDQAAKLYREKYMVSTKEIDDMRKAIELMDALRRIHSFLGNPDQTEKCKKTREAWKSFLEKEIKNLEKQKAARKRKK
jgi:hypothetical protein